MKPSAKRVLDMLKEQSVTQRQAVYMLENFRLAASIHELRQEGYAIETEHVPNHPARGGHHARYTLL